MIYGFSTHYGPLSLSAAIQRSMSKAKYDSLGYRVGQVLFPKYSPDMSVTQERSIGYDRYYALKLDLEPGDKLKLTIKVTYGPCIDILFMDDVNFQFYKDGQIFNYYSDYSSLSVKSKRFSLTAKNSGHHVFILDNTYKPAGGAVPDKYFNRGKTDFTLVLEGPESARNHVKPVE
jgi:hypothetical protein